MVRQGFGRGGRPAILRYLRLRDQYLAMWIRFQLPDQSSGEIERLLSGRTFDRREGNSNGFNQPQTLARAARGEGTLPETVIANARARWAWFESVYSSPFWEALKPSFPWDLGPTFPKLWLGAVGFSSPEHAGCWTEDCQLKHKSRWMVRRAGRTTSLEALALLIECGRREQVSLLPESVPGSYAVDVFRRLLSQARASASVELQHPFEALAPAIDLEIRKLLPNWKLLEQSEKEPAMIRPRPPWDFAEYKRRRKATRRAELRDAAKLWPSG